MKKTLFYIVITLLIGSIPNIFVGDISYLNKPFLYPNEIVFPIVWTVLFILMGISVSLVSEDEESKKLYFIQLLVNVLWTPLFFGLKLYFISFIWIILLIILVIKMIKTFKEKNELSAKLNIPYLCWLIFAAYLNLGILVLN